MSVVLILNTLTKQIVQVLVNLLNFCFYKIKATIVEVGSRFKFRAKILKTMCKQSVKIKWNFLYKF